MIFVIDAPAIIFVGRQHQAASIFDALHDLIVTQQMCFPDEVLEELQRLARGEFAYSWTKAAAASRFDRGAAYKHYVAVVSQVPGLVDADAEHESSAPCVLAQARSLMLEQQTIQVVTEDVRDKPTRLSLASACAQLGVSWCAMAECLRSCQVGHLLDGL
jgi:hypothetical protein